MKSTDRSRIRFGDQTGFKFDLQPATMATDRSRFWYPIRCLLLVIALVFAGLAFCVWFVRLADGYEVVATIDCGIDREIVITTARSWEYSRPICYFVRVDGEIVVASTCIDIVDPHIDPSTLRFAKFTNFAGTLVGITYADNPSRYLVIHDFLNNASFPRCDHIIRDGNLDDEQYRAYRDRARAELEDILNASRKHTANRNGEPADGPVAHGMPSET